MHFLVEVTPFMKPQSEDISSQGKGKRTIVAWIVAILLVLFGIVLFCIGQMLGALLLPDCPSFYSLESPIRCLQPMAYIIVGSCLFVSGIGIVVRKLISRIRERLQSR